MKLDLNENDVMLATILLLAGTIAVIALKQLEMINAAAPTQAIQYTQQPYHVPIRRAQTLPPKMLEPAPQIQQLETTISDVETVQETEVSELSPVTFLGYNESDDLVSVMKRMPNGEVMRRKIRDPDMSLNDLEVSKWIEYNEWQQEQDMDWI